MKGVDIAILPPPALWDLRSLHWVSVQNCKCHENSSKSNPGTGLDQAFFPVTLLFHAIPFHPFPTSQRTQARINMDLLINCLTAGSYYYYYVYLKQAASSAATFCQQEGGLPTLRKAAQAKRRRCALIPRAHYAGQTSQTQAPPRKSRPQNCIQ